MTSHDHCIGCHNPARDGLPRAECPACAELAARAESARIRYARETVNIDASRRARGANPKNGWTDTSANARVPR